VHSCQIPGKNLEIHLELKNGCINSCQFDGDFFQSGETTKIEKHLLNTRYTFQDVLAVIKRLGVKGNIQLHAETEIARCIMGI
jgi:hypothetical protein